MLALLRKFRPYALALGCVFASTACAYAVQPYDAQLSDQAMIHLLGIVLLSARFSVRVSVVACIASILAFDFFFVPPRFTLVWTDYKTSVTSFAMLVVAVVISSLNQRLRLQEEDARASASRAMALYQLNVDLSGASDVRRLSALTARHLEQLFSASVTVLLRTPQGALESPPHSADRKLAERAWERTEFTRGDDARGAAIWLPLVGVHASLGVIGLRLDKGFDKDSTQGFLLSTCANQLATAIERIQLTSAVHRTQLEAETERLRSSLLSAVSHDLKTPLATIIAAGTTLISRGKELSAGTASELLGSIVMEGERLSRMIQNLLSLSRLESPTIDLRRTPEAIEELVSSAIDRFKARLGGSHVRLELEHDLPLVSVEPVLIEQVLSNLLENAVRYAGPEASITVRASAGNGVLTVQVADRGPGIADDERDKVFEKFYRGRRASRSDGGVGLGLTICRAIVHAHGGRIGVRTQSGGGALVEFTLPAAEFAHVLLERGAEA